MLIKHHKLYWFQQLLLLGRLCLNCYSVDQRCCSGFGSTTEDVCVTESIQQQPVKGYSTTTTVAQCFAFHQRALQHPQCQIHFVFVRLLRTEQRYHNGFDQVERRHGVSSFPLNFNGYIPTIGCAFFLFGSLLGIFSVGHAFSFSSLPILFSSTKTRL